MNTDFVKSLADIISRHSQEDIHRELRILSMASRNESQDQIDIKRRLFFIALEFLNTHPNLPVDWRTSFDCYTDLTDWFETAEQIENHKALSALSWDSAAKVFNLSSKVSFSFNSR